MKRFIPILTLIGTSALIVGVDAKTNTNKTDYANNINDFKYAFANYNKTNPENITKTVANYQLEIENDSLNNDYGIMLLDGKENNIGNDITNLDENQTNNELENDNSSDDNTTKNENPNEENQTNNESNSNESEDSSNENQNTDTSENLEKFSTLYSLATDIEDSCNEFCELKTKILNAIAESEKLSEQLRNDELTLTREQRLFVNEQSNQLKNLAKQLNLATNELSFNLSDLNAIMKENNQDLDSLSLKYLIVLDSLINGNEMLQNGLGSLNLINNMMQINSKNLPSNNPQKILYGFSKNGNPPVIKEYTVDDNGELTGKEIEENNNETSKTNIDSYKNSILTPNIDSYLNNRRNIDSFFNTAWLDNGFMFGANNGGMYGNNLYNGYNNPSLYQYGNYSRNNQQNAEQNLNDNNFTPDTPNTNPYTKDIKHNNKKFKLKSNIDTYRDNNTPDIKTKIKNFKTSVNNFFKLKTEPKNKIIAPIFKFED